MRTAFYISDGTAITSEVFGHALLSLFPVEFEHDTISFVETKEKALEARDKINLAAEKSREPPLVFHTFVNPEILPFCIQCEYINLGLSDHKSLALNVDFFLFQERS